jgi:hypothetical protein
MNKIKKFIKGEFEHWKKSKLEQLKYELEHDIAKLEKTYNETKSDIIWDRLEMKRKELYNVSARLSQRRTKSS